MPIFEYDYIADGIFIGTNQCCTTHFAEALLKEGITADISLEEDRLDQPFGVEAYVWLPVKDHEPPTRAQLEIGVSALEKFAALGKKVYVHCKNGHGRAPTLVAAYMMRKGKSVKEAVALIRAQRPSVHLQDSQVAALQQWNSSR
ncbi:MAG: dual specificity protein phosphatase family protein [Candidatus Liptonbacteria bacterium]|nr:dual specificity protein phosphatase family protein [Candidatus Liptonbacteria bacterium]